MDPRESKACVLAALKTFATRDASAIAALFTTDVEWLAPAGNATAAALKMPSHIVGPEQLAAFLAEGFRTLLRDPVVEISNIIAAEDCVVVEETTRATLPDGRSYENEYCLIFTLLGGRIHRVREYMDTLKGFRQVFDRMPSGAPLGLDRA